MTAAKKKKAQKRKKHWRKRKKEWTGRISKALDLQSHFQRDCRNQNRGAVFKVFENLSEARDQYALYRSGDSDATLCKIPEGHAEQEKKDSRRRDCESHCYLQCCDKERIAIKDKGSREFYNSLHHWRS